MYKMVSFVFYYLLPCISLLFVLQTPKFLLMANLLSLNDLTSSLTCSVTLFHAYNEFKESTTGRKNAMYSTLLSLTHWYNLDAVSPSLVQNCYLVSSTEDIILF